MIENIQRILWLMDHEDLGLQDEQGVQVRSLSIEEPGGRPVSVGMRC